MKFGGWHRLWILVSILYSLAVLVFSTLLFPTQQGVRHSDALLSVVPPEHAALLLPESRPGTLVESSEFFAVPAFIETMPNGHELRFRAGADRATIATVVRAYEQALETELRHQRQTFALWTAAVWLVPCLAIYALGWAVGWVYRGFKAR